MSGFKINLDDVEPWKGGGIVLGPGTHPIKVVDEEVDLSGDHPVVMLQMEAIGGEEKGGEVRDWVHVTSKTLGRVAQIYEAFGVEIPSGEFEWISLKGKQAKAVVRREPKQDGSGDRTVVKGYSALGDAERVASQFKGSSIIDSDPGKPEEDIPF